MLHSIIKVTYVPKGVSVIVVCETQNDEREIRRIAGNAGMTVTVLFTSEDHLIYLNDIL